MSNSLRTPPKLPENAARLAHAAFAIAHIAGCDEPNSCAVLCDIDDQIAFGFDGCECLNMARAAIDQWENARV